MYVHPIYMCVLLSRVWACTGDILEVVRSASRLPAMQVPNVAVLLGRSLLANALAQMWCIWERQAVCLSLPQPSQSP